MGADHVSPTATAIDVYTSRQPQPGEISAFGFGRPMLGQGFAFQGREAPYARIRACTSYRWMPYVVRRLNELDEIGAGDTSHEVIAPSRKALTRVLFDARRFMPAEVATPSLVPTADRGVQLVWHRGGWDVEVDVLADRTHVWARRRDSGESWSGELNEVIEKLTRLLVEISR